MSLQQTVTTALDELVTTSGFHHAFVCTEGGLLVAGRGGPLEDNLASIVSLMDDIIGRVRRDLDLHRVDEVTLLDRERGRIVVRPVASGPSGRMFLVVSLPAELSWRRVTNLAVRRLGALLHEAVAS